MVLLACHAAEPFDGECDENGHFTLLVGNGKYKQCCEVSFEDEKTKANYSWRKAALVESDAELFIEEI